MRTLCFASQLAVEYHRRESGPAAICTDAKNTNTAILDGSLCKKRLLKL